MAAMALGTLIREARGDRTVRDVADYATRRGHRLDKSAVSDWETHGMKTLVPDRVFALAAGLQIPAYRVALAWLADQGIVIPFDARSPEDAVSHDHTLTPATRQQILALLRSARSGG